MSDNINQAMPKFAVKFEGVDCPSKWKIENFSDYFPVDGFSRPGHFSAEGPQTQQATLDGQTRVQSALPVSISFDKKVRPYINKLVGIGLLADKTVKMVELQREQATGAEASWEATLTGVWIEGIGDTIHVTYQKYEDTAYYKDEAPIPGGFDFIKQKKIS
jgi:hypothetical protein